MKTIKNIELLKKLQPYIKGKTEFIIFEGEIQKDIYKEEVLKDYDYLKTLTTDETIELLHNNGIGMSIRTGTLDIENNLMYSVEWNIDNTTFLNSSLLQVIESMLEYLIDNNLLGDTSN